MASPSWMLERLSQETAVHHRDADAPLDGLFRPSASVDSYQTFLMSSYGFEAPLEAALSMSATVHGYLDLKGRARAGLLAHDLMRLGLRPNTVAELPMCLAVPNFRSAAEALGWMYVVERAALTHQVVHRHLMTRFPRELTAASAYLQAAGGMLGTHWRQFGEALDRVASHPVVADRVCASANSAFRVFVRWTETAANIAQRVAS